MILDIYVNPRYCAAMLLKHEVCVFFVYIVQEHINDARHAIRLQRVVYRHSHTPDK